MFTEEEKLEIVDYLIETPGNIYIGCDSEKFKKKGVWFAKYTIVFIIHIENARGGRIFHYSVVEQVFDKQMNKPKMRLMTEVRKIVDCYLEFGELLEDRNVEIHLDINSDPDHNSNLVVKEALGYVKGMTGLDAKIKPDAFAAAHCADHFVRNKHNKK